MKASLPNRRSCRLSNPAFRYFAARCRAVPGKRRPVRQSRESRQCRTFIKAETLGHVALTRKVPVIVIFDDIDAPGRNCFPRPDGDRIA